MKKILIVDDEAEIRSVVRLTIESQFSFVCMEASDGAVAKQIVDSDADQIALIICDYHMPNCTGGELFFISETKALRFLFCFVRPLH